MKKNVNEKYTNLTDCLLKASEKSLEAASKVDDGGTCNLDSLFVVLPRYNEEKTIAAIEASGLSGFKSSFYRTVGYIINPPVVGQANKRSAAAEALKKYMASCGYDVTGFYVMD